MKTIKNYIKKKMFKYRIRKNKSKIEQEKRRRILKLAVARNGMSQTANNQSLSQPVSQCQLVTKSVS